MNVTTHTTDSQARLALPSSFVNTRVEVEQISETEVRVRRLSAHEPAGFPFPAESAAALSELDRELFLQLLSNSSALDRALQEAAARRAPSRP